VFRESWLEVRQGGFSNEKGDERKATNHHSMRRIVPVGKLRKQSGKKSGFGRQLRQRGVEFGVGKVVSGKQRFMEVIFVQTIQFDDDMIRAGKRVLLFFFSFFPFFIRIVRTCLGKFVHHAAPQLLNTRNREVRCHDEQQKEGEKKLHIKDLTLSAAKVTVFTGKPCAPARSPTI